MATLMSNDHTLILSASDSMATLMSNDHMLILSASESMATLMSNDHMLILSTSDSMATLMSNDHMLILSASHGSTAMAPRLRHFIANAATLRTTPLNQHGAGLNEADLQGSERDMQGLVIIPFNPASLLTLPCTKAWSEPRHQGISRAGQRILVLV